MQEFLGYLRKYSLLNTNSAAWNCLLHVNWMVWEWNPGGREVFLTHPDRPMGPPSLIYNEYQVSFLGVKRPRRGVDHPPPFRAEAKES
jgi:hypothetical protein